MNKQAYETKFAPAPVGPYSQAVKSGNLIFLSGQIGIDPAASKIVEGGVEAQTKQVFKNIKAILNEAGTDFANIIKATVFLKDMADFNKVNVIYAQHFEKPFPARSAVAVKELPLSADVEIEVIASL
jgi:2-iminobutanoate/2-iminopropanoate deaminase